MSLQLMTYLLSAFGYACQSATDGEEGLETALREHHDVIICDIDIPKLDGFEVARKLKSEPAKARVPLVAVTALAMVGDRDRILAAGFDGYIAKPIAPEDFVSHVEAFLSPSARLVRPEITPATAAAAVNRPSEVEATASILVVDDSVSNAEVLKAILIPFGYDVTHAVSAERALITARAKRPDLIICDVHMPGVSGFDFLKLLKADAFLAGVPFIFISSTIRNKELSQQTSGVTKFLLRPIDPEIVLQEVRSSLAEKVSTTKISSTPEE